MLYQYVKASSQKPEITPESNLEPVNNQPSPNKSKKIKKLIPSILITLGSILIVNVIWPIISHELIFSPKIRREPILSPLQDSNYIQTIESSRTTSTNQPQQVLGSSVDYKKASNWFPSVDFNDKGSYQVSQYSISIPEVNIEDAKVIIGGEDLDESTIHFPGTALPGQLGSPVIFGHSILRQFYAPQIDNKDRYISIFSKIMTLEEDDEIFINFDGIQYLYKVKEKVEVQAEDVFILHHRLNNRELKLITCTPEGTYLRRGVVIAELAEVY